MDRRQLLIAGGATLLGSRLAFAQRPAERADVIVIGSGGAGFTSAITAFDAGAKVIVLEKMPITGGNSQLASGGMNGAGTPVQKKKGIDDNWESMYKDTIKNGGQPELVELLAKNSVSSVEYLDSLGADLSDVAFFAGSSNARTHRPQGGSFVGRNIIHTLRQNALKRKMDVRTGSRVKALLQDKNGRIAGVEVMDRIGRLYTIEAPAVILASGGFSSNPELVHRYRSDLKNMASTNQPGATGDGLALATALGARLVDMDKILINPTQVTSSKILITSEIRNDGAIMVNREGRRFVDELMTRDKISAAEMKQTDGYGVLIYGENTRKKLSVLSGYEHLGVVTAASGPEALAEKLGLDGKALAKTISDYNRYQKEKKDPEFGRAEMLFPIDTPTLYAIPVRPGVHYTMGGVAIDTKTRVLRKEGPIDGLFAAGEVTGGIHGKNRIGGNSISETVTFGRIAGAQAAEYAKAVRKV